MWKYCDCLTLSLTVTLWQVAIHISTIGSMSMSVAGSTSSPSEEFSNRQNANNTSDTNLPESLRQTKSYPYHYNSSLNCSLLKMGQYFCADPDIDANTQQAINCSEKTRTVKVPCYPVKGIYCNGQEHSGDSIGFYQEVPCKWTNGKEFSVAVLLSVFLGWLGIDRFYLGYPAIGLLKFCTFGFMFLGHLLDILLIAIQVVGPSDGSAYVVDFYGAGLSRIDRDNFTYIRPPSY